MENIFQKIFPEKSLFGHSADRYGAKEEISKSFRFWKQTGIYCTDMRWKEEILIFLLSSLTNGTLLSLYGVKEEKMNFFRFQLNKQLFAGQIWCGRRKRIKFLDLVMKSPVAVPIWSRKGNFFSTMEAKRHFHSLYDVKRRLCFLQQVRLSCPYMVWKEENKAIFAKIHRSICTNSVKGNFFFQLFFDN